jgi:basic membrane lipoprotein Med (substrate-binding protein (PBP1-ABC) superfamily)
MKKLLTLALVVLLTITLFAGCAKPEEKPPVEEKIKVIGIYATPIEEPWDGAIHQALLKAKDELGIDYQWVESVGYSDFERVLREYADKGPDIIMGDAFGNEESVRRVAKDYPKIAFAFGSGGGPADPNFAVFDDWIHEPAYLCGVIAGKITKSNIIGVVGGYPVPEVNRIVNAFVSGVKEVNAKAKVKVTFIGSWFDPPKAKEAAIAQIEAGADVMFGERYGVIDACKEKGVPVFGNVLDQSELAPDSVITGPVWNMWPTVQYVVESVKNKSFTAVDLKDWSMMTKGGAYLAPYHNWDTKLAQDVKDLVEKKKNEIMEGLLRVVVDENTPKSD